ncbi:MAG: hypothetical protein EBR82_07985 [Caulobacteraceae bacterium]|nr:hypothetical protein [Caulobacteraceae bacterium]
MDSQNGRVSETLVFDPRNIRSIHAAFDPDFKDSANLLAQGEPAVGVRGDFTIWRADARWRVNELERQTRIRLYAARDMSTMLHETGHLFLEVMRTLAPSSPQIAAQLEDVRQWAGLKDGEDFEERHHELFARTFEAYLMEGKSPSLRLRKAFEAFKAWLTAIYRAVTGRLVTRDGIDYGATRLSPEIRAVFDRMVATDAEIAQARALQGMEPLTQAQLGLTDEAYAKYLASFERARVAAENDLRAETIRQVMRKKRAEWKRREAQHRRVVTLNVNGRREYRAEDLFTDGRWRDGVGVGQALPPDEAMQDRDEAEAAGAQAEREIIDGRSYDQFAGPRARTADLSKLKQAQDRVAAGEDPEQVRKDTGWFKDSAGQWQFEISTADVRVRLTPEAAAAANASRRLNAMEVRHALMVGDMDAFMDPLSPLAQHYALLPDVLDAKDLIEAYPDLASLRVVFVNMPAGFNGAALPEDYQTGRPGFILLDSHLSIEKARSTLIHELQHVIQASEEWMVGGMPEQASAYIDLADQDTVDAVLLRLKAAGLPATSNNVYRVFTGEDQAFESEARRNMTPEELQATPPVNAYAPSLPTRPNSRAGLEDFKDRVLKRFGIVLSVGPSLSREPLWFSALERAVEGSQTKKASAAQWWATLSKTPGVKKEELEWTGLKDWLDGQEAEQARPGRNSSDKGVSRDDILAFVRANGVRVEETVLGDMSLQNREQLDELQRELLPLVEEQDRLRAELDTLANFARNADDQRLKTAAAERQQQNRARLRVIGPQILDLMERQDFLRGDNVRTKWSSYTLPGGENYRELLLRLPGGTRDDVRPSPEVVANYQEEWDGLVVQVREARAKGQRAYETEVQDKMDELHARMVRETIEQNPRLVRDPYTSSHWDEPNVLAHVRFKERTDADGARVLAIEEVQSDWHQAGREKGYKAGDAEQRLRDAEEAQREAYRAMDVASNAGRKYLAEVGDIDFQDRQAAASHGAVLGWLRLRKGDAQAAELAARVYEAMGAADRAAEETRGARAAATKGVPDAPFKNNAWAALALKRMVRWAAENGFDKIAWIPGQVAVERFGIEKQIDSLELWKDRDGREKLYAYRGDRMVQEITITEQQPLEAVIGKELAEKLRNGQRNTTADRAEGGEHRSLSGVDLKIGGDGMRAFYDRILPNIANDLGKKYGAKVGEAKIGMGAPSKADLDARWARIAAGEDGVPHPGEAQQKMHSLPITPALKEAALGGFPMFQNDPSITPDPKPDWWKKMKLDRRQIEETYGPEVAAKLEGMFATAEEEAATAAAEIEKANADLKQAKRLWVWIREKGGIRADDAGAIVDGDKRFPMLVRKNGMGLDDLARAAVEEGFAPMRKDADGYIIPLDPEELLDMLRRDVGGDPQYRVTNDEARETLARYQASGIDTSLTGKALREQVRETMLEQARLGVDPDEIAPLLGFSSGDEMIQALAARRPRADVIKEETDAAMRDEFGDMMEDGSLMDEAKLRAHAVAQEKALEIELEAIRRATGGRARPMAAAAKQAAERQLKAMTVGQVLNPDQFLAAERRFGMQAQKALARGDTAAALEAKHRQLVSWHLYRGARAAADKVQKAVKRWSSLSDSTTVRNGIAEPERDMIDMILERIDLKPRSRAEERRSAAEWFMSVEARGLSGMRGVDPETLAQIGPRPMRSLTVAEFDEVAEVIRNIAFLGRNVGKMLAAERAREVEEVKRGLLDRAEAEWKGALDPKSRPSDSLLARARRNVDAFHGANLKIDYLMRLMDGLKDNGPWARIFSHPAQEAADRLHQRQIATMQQFAALLERQGVTRKELGQMLTRNIWIPEIGENLTRHQIVSVALNMGNEYNREGVKAGEGWDDAQLAAVLAKMRKQDWDLVQALWDHIGQWKEESFALDEKTRGVRPREVIAAPVQTPFGTYRGGYWPVAFDPLRSDAAAKREARDAVNAELGGGYRTPATARGRLEARQGTGGQPFRLDWLGVLDKHTRETLTDLTHRELVIDLRRLKADSRIRLAISNVAGDGAVRALDDWVNRLTRKAPVTAYGDLGGIAAYLRRTGTQSQMGFKLSVGLLNALGALQAIPRNGFAAQLKQSGISFGRDFPLMVASQIGSLFGGDGTMPKRVAFVREKSAMMNARMGQFDREIANDTGVLEVKATVLGRRDYSLMSKDWEDAAHYFTGLMDAAVSVPTWLAAYENAMAGKVGGIELADEAAAIRHADQVVRTTQGSGATQDLSALLATNNEFQRLFTMFMSWANGFYNQLFAEQFPGVMRGKISPVRFAVNMIAIWLLPAFLSAWFYGLGDDGEDEDKKARQIVTEVLLYPAQSIPFVRDALSSVFEDYRPQTPLATALDRAGRLSGAVEGGDGEKIAKQSYMLFGSLFGAPTQFWVTGDYLYDVTVGDEDLQDWTDPETAGDAFSQAFVRDTR